MNYEETLNKVENFMVKSGIREFCTEVCQGYCCGNCYNSKNACHRNEGRRLSCSVFLCANLRNLIFSSHANMKAYIEMERVIIHKLSEILVAGKNPYIDICRHPHNKESRNKFSIDGKSLDILDKINLEEIKNKLRAIRNIHIVSSRFLMQKLSKHME